jgi:hypothetical protein
MKLLRVKHASLLYQGGNKMMNSLVRDNGTTLLNQLIIPKDKLSRIKAYKSETH